MSFTYNTNIPATNNNPSVDQPDMLTNTQSIDGLLAVDHISFNTANGGNHLQVHLPSFQSPTVVNGTGTQGSVIYSAAGTADAAYAQAFLKNAHNLNFPMSLIRAFGFVDGGAGGITASQSINVTSAVRNSTGNYTITLSANTVATANFAILLTCTPRPIPGLNPISINYSITGVGTFTVLTYDLFNNVLTDPANFSFVVLQI